MGRWARCLRLVGLAAVAAVLVSCGGPVDSPSSTLAGSPGGSPPTEADRPPPNPNPPKGLASYDLPNKGSDLNDQDNWQPAIEDKCQDLGHPRRCLTLVYLVRSGGKQIPNPGADYSGFERCLVTDLRPPPRTQIPVGTKITVEVECEPEGRDESETGAVTGAADADNGP